MQGIFLYYEKCVYKILIIIQNFLKFISLFFDIRKKSTDYVKYAIIKIVVTIEINSRRDTTYETNDI